MKKTPPKLSEPRPKPTQTPKQIAYATDKIRSIAAEFDACHEIMSELNVTELQIRNWRHGTNGLAKLSDLAVEMRRELERIRDRQSLLPRG